jgi:hypothetical protein
MKQLLFACLCAGIMGTTCAQDSMNSFTAGNLPVRSKTYLNDISTTASRDFVKRYDNALDAKWYKVPDGWIAKCTLDNHKASVAYDRHGNWVYTMKTYAENKMPRDVRAIVKSTYYDYQIVVVQEILKGKYPVVYVVHLQDSTCWKNVRVCEGEMEIIEEYQKRK